MHMRNNGSFWHTTEDMRPCFTITYTAVLIVITDKR